MWGFGASGNVCCFFSVVLSMGLFTETDFCPYIAPRNSRCEQLELGFCQVVMTATCVKLTLSAGDPL